MSTDLTVQTVNADLTAALSAPLKEQDIKVRPGAKGMPLKYIAGKTAIEHANALFGFGKWGYKVVARSHDVIRDERNGSSFERYTCDIGLK